MCWLSSRRSSTLIINSSSFITIRHIFLLSSLYETNDRILDCTKYIEEMIGKGHKIGKRNLPGSKYMSLNSLDLESSILPNHLSLYASLAPKHGSWDFFPGAGIFFFFVSLKTKCEPRLSINVLRVSHPNSTQLKLQRIRQSREYYINCVYKFN